MSSRTRRFAAYLRQNGARLYFLASLGIGLFAYGVAVSVFRIFPYDLLVVSAAAGVDWAKYPRHQLGLAPEKYLNPARHAGSGVVRHVPEQASPGQTFMTGYFGDGPGMRLIDMQGRTLHEWRVPYEKIWPEAPHMDPKPGNWETHIHGALLYPNGDVIFNFQYGGLVRIDRCSRVRWRLAHQTHHSLYQDGRGHLWVPGRRLREQPVAKFPNVPAPFQEEFLLEVSPDGEILREISVLDVIFDSGYEGVLFATGTHEAKIEVPLDHDFTHLNDIEVLEPELAAAFPQFAAGDLLVSLRNLNLLMVIDPDTRRIKWSQTGPFLRQHDPDFLPNGRISVFDNRRGGTGPDTPGASRILEIDPRTGVVATLYGDRRGEQFYTETMGDHQWLPNGNLLITETHAGRVFEVTPEREIAWSFVNRWDEDSVAWVERGLRYPERYMTEVGQEGCS